MLWKGIPTKFVFDFSTVVDGEDSGKSRIFLDIQLANSVMRFTFLEFSGWDPWTNVFLYTITEGNAVYYDEHDSYFPLQPLKVETAFGEDIDALWNANARYAIRKVNVLQLSSREILLPDSAIMYVLDDVPRNFQDTLRVHSLDEIPKVDIVVCDPDSWARNYFKGRATIIC